jgi:hypothetical protein
MNIEKMPRPQVLKAICIALADGDSYTEAGAKIGKSKRQIEYIISEERAKRRMPTIYRLMSEQLAGAEHKVNDLTGLPPEKIEPLLKLAQGVHLKAITTNRYNNSRKVENQLFWLKAYTHSKSTLQMVAMYVRAFGLPERKRV